MAGFSTSLKCSTVWWPVAPARALWISLFHGIEQPVDVGLYHSWAVEPDALPSELQAIAHSEKGVIMALRHARYNTCGLQFHPESVMTPAGPRIIANWIQQGNTIA